MAALVKAIRAPVYCAVPSIPLVRVDGVVRIKGLPPPLPPHCRRMAPYSARGKSVFRQRAGDLPNRPGKQVLLY